MGLEVVQIVPTATDWQAIFAQPLSDTARADLERLRSFLNPQGFALNGEVLPDLPRKTLDLDSTPVKRRVLINHNIVPVGYKVCSYRPSGTSPWWDSRIFLVRVAVEEGEREDETILRRHLRSAQDSYRKAFRKSARRHGRSGFGSD